MSGNYGNESNIIELSIDETNKLRAELGLAPLRVNNNNNNNNSSNNNSNNY